MRKLLIVLMLLISLASQATVYHVAASGGDYSTLAQVNAATFVAGDQILFNKGETFYGALSIDESGSSGNPIIYGAYGTGANPIITGFTSVTAWTNQGSNIWESTNAVSTLTTCNMVTINGVNTAMGRIPNSDAANGGYLTIDSHSGNTQITDAVLTGTPNWTGASVIIRTGFYIINRAVISSQTTSTLNFSPATTYEPGNGWGYFIENDIRTLDAQNEWYYNPSTKKISIYSTSQPSNVNISSLENLTTVHGSYITIENISFTGANNNAIYNQEADDNYSRFIFRNCSISFSGESGIKLKNQYASILNNTISDSQNNGIHFTQQLATDSIYVKNNTITNSGLLAGMNIINADGGTLSGITLANKSNGIIQYNVITNSGYCGFTGHGSYLLIKNNLVDNFCSVMDDGGGIYVFESSYTVITENIVLNGWGASYGTNSSIRNSEGIYLDYGTNNTEISYNTSINNRSGIFTHASDINVHHNIVYNNSWYQMIEYDPAGGIDNVNNQINNNQFICRASNQIAIEIDYPTAHPQSIGTLDYNCYARPIDDTNTIRIWPVEGAAVNYTLAEWKALLGKDANSYKSPQTISNLNDFQVLYNASTTTSTETLSQPMIDMQGNQYSTSINVPPYRSYVLLIDQNPPIPGGLNNAWGSGKNLWDF